MGRVADKIHPKLQFPCPNAPLKIRIESDVALYEITVVDAAGLTVVDAAPPVSVRVEGAAQLVGLDTGDIETGELFKSTTRKAFQCRLLASVRRTSPMARFSVSASTPGLPMATAASALAPR